MNRCFIGGCFSTICFLTSILLASYHRSGCRWESIRCGSWWNLVSAHPFIYWTCSGIVFCYMTSSYFLFLFPLQCDQLLFFFVFSLVLFTIVSVFECIFWWMCSDGFEWLIAHLGSVICKSLTIWIYFVLISITLIPLDAWSGNAGHNTRYVLLLDMCSYAYLLVNIFVKQHRKGLSA